MDEPQNPEKPNEPGVTEDPQELTLGDVYHYGRTNNKVNLRKDTSTKATMLGELSSDTLLWVKEQIANSSGELWCSVKVVDSGKEGYVLSKFVTLMGEVEEFNFRNALENPEPLPTPKPEETATPIPEETMPPQPEETPTPQPEETAAPQPEASATPAPYAGYAKTLRNNVFVRSVANANASTVATVSLAGTVVNVLDQQYVDGQRWHLVTYGDCLLYTSRCV